jgi:hypothetical protein
VGSYKRVHMHESRNFSFGVVLGWIAVMGGVLWLGSGFAYLRRGLGPVGVDDLLFGLMAFFAGYAILYRRAMTAKSK